jgi:hypothetical protein
MLSLIKRNITKMLDSKAIFSHFVTAAATTMTYVVNTYVFDHSANNETVPRETIDGIPRTVIDETMLRRYSASKFYERTHFSSFSDEE